MPAAMVRKQTPEQMMARARAMQEKVSKLSQNSQVAEVEEIMKAHKHLVPAIHRYCRQLVEAPPAAAQELQAPPSPAVTLTAEQHLQAALARPIDRQNYRMEMLPIKDMKTVLYMCNGDAFSPWALKALQNKGARDCSKLELCKVLEFISGIAGQSDLSNQFFKTIGDIGRHMKALSDSRGDRGASLKLPPDWCEQGVYQIIRRSSDELVVKNRFYPDAEAKITAQDFKFQDPDQCWIDVNWSENRACLRERGTVADFIACVAFAKAGVQLALADGSVTTPPRHAKRAREESEASAYKDAVRARLAAPAPKGKKEEEEEREMEKDEKGEKEEERWGEEGEPGETKDEEGKKEAAASGQGGRQQPQALATGASAQAVADECFFQPPQVASAA